MKTVVAAMTFISAILFCALIAISSLSPLVHSGPNVNEFNSLGMWLAIGMILVFYLLPLVFYLLGVRIMKYVLAVFCGFGLLIGLFTIAGILVFVAFTGNTSDFLGVIIVCIALIISNVIWYIAAFCKTADLKHG